MSKTAVVCGAGGFIAAHLVKRLKNEGYWVRGVDIKLHEHCETKADEFIVGDLNLDNYVNILDVVLLVSYILGDPIDDFISVDINQDGFINVLDVVELVSIITEN